VKTMAVEQAIATNARRYRLARGLQSQAVAIGLSMAPPVYSDLERGVRRIKVDELVTLAAILSVPPVNLMATDQPGVALKIGQINDTIVAVSAAAMRDFVCGRMNDEFAGYVKAADFLTH